MSLLPWIFAAFCGRGSFPCKPRICSRLLASPSPGPVRRSRVERSSGEPHVSSRQALNIQRILTKTNESGAVGKEPEIR